MPSSPGRPRLYDEPRRTVAIRATGRLSNSLTMVSEHLGLPRSTVGTWLVLGKTIPLTRALGLDQIEMPSHVRKAILEAQHSLPKVFVPPTWTRTKPIGDRETAHIQLHLPVTTWGQFNSLAQRLEIPAAALARQLLVESLNPLLEELGMSAVSLEEATLGEVRSVALAEVPLAS